MSTVLKLPRLGETMEEGRVVAWLVAEGETFSRGDALVEIETDKTVVEVPALGPGRILERLVEEGSTVELGMPLARIEVEGADWTREDEGPGSEPETKPKADTESRPEAGGGADKVKVAQTGAALSDAAAPSATAEKVRATETGAKVRATPLARRLARHRGIDIAEVTGTGRRGRVERADVAQADVAQVDIARSGTGAEGELFLRDAGPEDGPPVILLHGFAGDGTSWAGLSAQLVRDGRRVLVPDLPGHGATAREAATLADLSDGLAPALGARTGAEPVHLVAHSLGAVPALALAEVLPTASLTLISPAGLSLDIDSTFVRGLARASGAAEVGYLLERMVDGPLPLSAEAVAKIHADLSAGRLARLADAAVGETGQAVNLRAALASLAERIPVHLIVGHRDRIVPWQDSVTVSPRIAVHHLTRAGHMPHWEAAAEVHAVLRQITSGRS